MNRFIYNFGNKIEKSKITENHDIDKEFKQLQKVLVNDKDKSFLSK